MGWTQIAQVVPRTIDRVHSSKAQHLPHRDRGGPTIDAEDALQYRPTSGWTLAQ
jgi:hypothetical protein